MSQSDIPIQQRLTEYLPSKAQKPPQVPGLVRSTVLLVLAIVLALAAAVADAYLHRGIETSAEPPIVLHVAGNSLATNLDLRAFPASQIETIAATIRANGFRYVRHPVKWEEIETERGQFNWESYDSLFRSFEDAGVEVIAVVSGTPLWARSESTQGFPDAPPENVEDYADFVETLAQRYIQYLHFIQVFDHPNDP